MESDCAMWAKEKAVKSDPGGRTKLSGVWLPHAGSGSGLTALLLRLPHLAVIETLHTVSTHVKPQKKTPPKRGKNCRSNCQKEKRNDTGVSPPCYSLGGCMSSISTLTKPPISSAFLMVISHLESSTPSTSTKPSIPALNRARQLSRSMALRVGG